MTTEPVLAISSARNNAELVEQCVALNYLARDWRTLDPTYGKGRFWRRWRPLELIGHDLDPDKAPHGPADFTRLPYGPETFDVVVFDGPYKLNGAAGSHASDEDYGVATSASWAERHDLLRAGITEAARIVVPARRVRVDRGRYELEAGIVLIKCQDQVCAGAVRWQTREFADHAETVGLDLVDALLLVGHRAQPQRTRKHGECRGTGMVAELGGFGVCLGCHGNGRVPSRQHHAARNYSTLLVTRKAPQ